MLGVSQPGWGYHGQLERKSELEWKLEWKLQLTSPPRSGFWAKTPVRSLGGHSHKKFGHF